MLTTGLSAFKYLTISRHKFVEITQEGIAYQKKWSRDLKLFSYLIREINEGESDFSASLPMELNVGPHRLP